MRITAIPEWNDDGLLPAVGNDPTGPDRSPYHVPLIALIERFAITAKRCVILEGLLRYRAALHECGLKLGVQWINGSFAEDVENREARAPNDVDVVTFFELPDGATEERLMNRSPDLFDHEFVKKNYFVDAYPINIIVPYKDEDNGIPTSAC